VLEEVDREAVAEHVGGHVLAELGARRMPEDAAADRLLAEAAAACAQEDDGGRPSPVEETRASFTEVAPQPADGRLADRDAAVGAVLRLAHGDEPVGEVEGVELELARLVQAKPRGVEELEERAVAQAELAARLDPLEEPLDLVFAEPVAAPLARAAG
jgi:hypothetical protein